ncbi:hypothetical protein [Sphaerisporangium dianthi]
MLIVSAIGYSATTRTDPVSAVPSASARSCEQPPSRALVRPGGGAVTFPDVSYAIEDVGGRPRIDLAGSYEGVIDEGERVAVIVRADIGSYDSASGGPPGEGRYYFQRELQLDEEAHCWTALSLSPALSLSSAHHGAEGPLWHIYLVLVPADFAVTSVSTRGQVEGGVFTTLEVLADFIVTA